MEEKIHQVEHHRSHLASAFFASPFEESALLSIDGSGDFSTTMTGIGRDKSIEVLESVDSHTPLVFSTPPLRNCLVFRIYGDEYKVMGLAPYGQPRYVDKLRDVLIFKNNGLFELNLKYFRSATQGIISYGDDHIPVVAPLYTHFLTRKIRPPRERRTAF
jgi:carbamoyltransferase